MALNSSGLLGNTTVMLIFACHNSADEQIVCTNKWTKEEIKAVSARVEMLGRLMVPFCLCLAV